jgi:chemotaxis response regulator CheB
MRGADEELVQSLAEEVQTARGLTPRDRQTTMQLLYVVSAVKVYGRRTLALVMTGMGKDGAAGALAIKRAEGKTCAQDQQTSVTYGMPKTAIDAAVIDEVLPLADIAGWLRYA